jgi:hypothetical protein
MSEQEDNKKESMLEKIDTLLDLNYKLPEYNESEYLYNAECVGADKILQIEKQFDNKQKTIFA